MNDSRVRTYWTVWITANALSSGIREVRTSNVTSKEWLWFDDPKSRRPDGQTLVGKGHWHLSQEAAITKAKRMRQQEIKKLKARLAQLQELKFTPS